MKLHLIAVAALAISALPAQAPSVSSAADIDGSNRLVDFEAFDGLLFSVPVEVAAGISFTGDANTELGANNRDLGENGLWGGFGNHFVAAGDSGELTFTFANLASGVGAFLNHYAATPGSGSVTLSAFGSTGQLLETYLFSIGTSVDGYDQGQFYGINRSQFDIRSFTFSGVGAVADNLTVAMVPEPEGYALMLAGLGLMGWMTRRRQRG